MTTAIEQPAADPQPLTGDAWIKMYLDFLERYDSDPEAMFRAKAMEPRAEEHAARLRHFRTVLNGCASLELLERLNGELEGAEEALATVQKEYDKVRRRRDAAQLAVDEKRVGIIKAKRTRHLVTRELWQWFNLDFWRVFQPQLESLGFTVKGSGGQVLERDDPAATRNRRLDECRTCWRLENPPAVEVITEDADDGTHYRCGCGETWRVGARDVNGRGLLRRAVGRLSSLVKG